MTVISRAYRLVLLREAEGREALVGGRVEMNTGSCRISAVADAKLMMYTCLVIITIILYIYRRPLTPNSMPPTKGVLNAYI